MVNTHKKGQKKELLCQKQLEAEGWITLFRSYTIKMGPIFRGIDFAQLFDVIACHEKERRWKFISVKNYSNSTNHLSHRVDIHAFAQTHGLPNSSFELWNWKKPQWRGRGKSRKWVAAHFEREIISESGQ